jgi:hypothetical protein
MSNYGVCVAKIERLLCQHGELTSAEICDELGMNRKQGGAVLSRMNRELPTLPKRIYKAKYIYEHEGQRRYPRSVYALGDLPDVKKPKADQKKNVEQYRSNQKKKVASVFHLGLTRNQKKEMRASA